MRGSASARLYVADWRKIRMIRVPELHAVGLLVLTAVRYSEVVG